MVRAQDFARIVAMITLLSDSGRELAAGTVRPGHSGQTLELDHVVRGKGQLLHYFFGRGKRAVIVEAGDFRLRGTLATRWLGQERRWEVALERPRRVGTALPRALDSSAPPPPRH